MYYGLLAAAAKSAPTWGLFNKGQAVAFLAILLFAIFVYTMINRARSGAPMRAIHKIAGLEAIDESIGRATEMGRPVHYSMGLPDIQDASTIASLPVLGYVSKACARYDTRVIHSTNDVVVYSIASEVVRQSYLEAGRPDAFNPDDVRFLTDWQFAYTAGVFELLEREKPATQILYGRFYAEAMILVEAGALAGAVQIGATAKTAQLPFFVAGCDYALIGEELFAASAYLTKEPVITGTVVAEDLFKFLVFAVIILGVVAVNLGMSNLAGYFKM